MDNGKPHHGKPQQTSDFEGSRNEFVATLFRGLGNLQGFKMKLNIDIKAITEYDLTPEIPLLVRIHRILLLEMMDLNFSKCKMIIKLSGAVIPQKDAPVEQPSIRTDN